MKSDTIQTTRYFNRKRLTELFDGANLDSKIDEIVSWMVQEASSVQLLFSEETQNSVSQYAHTSR